MYTVAGQTSALQQNFQSSEKTQHFKKNTIFNQHPVYVFIFILDLEAFGFTDDFIFELWGAITGKYIQILNNNYSIAKIQSPDVRFLPRMRNIHKVIN